MTGHWTHLRDLVDETTAGVAARPGRLALTVLGTALGVAALVATVGIAQTAGGQISAQFDAITATEVVVGPRTSTVGDAEEAVATLPWDAQARIERLTGVVAAGTVGEVDVGDARVRTVPILDPQGRVAHDLPVLAASAGTLDAVRGTVAHGRWFDAGHDRRGDRVAVVGARAADRLHLTRVTTQPSVFVGDERYTVIGILDPVPRRIDFDDAVILPQTTARHVHGLAALDEVRIHTDLGAAHVVGDQAPVALDPNRPDGFEAQVPPSPDALRTRVQANVNALFLLLGAVALVVGALGIANVTLLSVLERVGEIGLRGALGATRGQIARQFLAESITIGLIGGLIGASAGVIITVTVSVTRAWTPILDVRLALTAPLLGAAIGLLAGGYPAWKAATLDPIHALGRSG